MHILLTNDDGPPSPHASPYIASFVRTLRSPPFNHTVSVVIPSQQRSWIGKAHLLPPSTYAPPPPGGERSKNEDITDVITPRFYLPDTGEVSDTIPAPAGDGSEAEVDYWVLVPGTPAACAQLGIFHHASLFPHRRTKSQVKQLQDPHHPSSLLSPIDLVISGPNLGRNTSAAFALSSGTLGGALEAAISGVRAIAVSFAFFTKREPQAVVDEACVLAAKICERLCVGWEKGGGGDGGEDGVGDGKARWYVGPETGEGEGRDTPDLYTVNVPLVEGIAEKEVKWTWMLNQKWTTGSLYSAVDPANTSSLKSSDTEPNSTPTFSDNKPSTTTTTTNPPQSLTQPSAKSTTPSQPQPQPQPPSSTPSDSSSPRTHNQPTFKWAPTFKDMFQTVAASPAGNDGLVVTQQASSVTPLKANLQGLWGRGGFVGVLKL